MAACKEITRPFLPSLHPSNGFPLLRGKQSRLFWGSPALHLDGKKMWRSSFRPMKPARAPAVVVATAVSEELVNLAMPNPPKLRVRAALTVRRKQKEDPKESLFNHLDALSDRIGRTILLELISNELNPRKKNQVKGSEAVIKDWWEKMCSGKKGDHVVYTAEFEVDADFGEPGAIAVTNRHQREFFLESIVVEGFDCGPVYFPCDSWVQSTKDLPSKRIFFSNKPYLPSETPAGLKELRLKELKELRGDGTGIRKSSDRIYDYATYNDLGNPDQEAVLARPTAGGEKMPYPRRCRTGRPPTDTNMFAESRAEKSNPVYVPRDEAFEELKQLTFSAGRLRAVLHSLIPCLIASMSAEHHDFRCFHHIDNLYKEGLVLKRGLQEQLLKKLPFLELIHESSQGGFLRYDTPRIISKDKFAWLRDDEFARQALAGINPVNIERVRTFPLVSKLDPAIYGPQESAITEEHIAGQLEGLTLQQVLEEGKLFMLDYHDIYLPFVGRINALDGRKTYATRTLFLLTRLGTLKPIAIELGLSPEQGSGGGGYRPNTVLTPPCDATTNWLWMLGKAHVCANDAGVHQLVNHWLRTHAVMEPFILAAHRQLSAMHPIFKLLHPHMRYTLEINALARENLINADGVIESCFTPGPHCTEISAAYYKNHWRFDLESLPADLLRRGMAVEDRSQPHGLRLVVTDYPYANDGLLLWSAITNYVRSYVELYYPDSDPGRVQSDSELQSWYHESKVSGHADLCHAPWWPQLDTAEDLVKLLTTLIWLASVQHAALNFGQYPLGGYVPSRPPLLRRLIPDPARDSDEYAKFRADPQRFFLATLPSVLQATKYMAVVDTLSTHSPDEEYLGQEEGEGGAAWTSDEAAVAAYREFSAAVSVAEEEIKRRNEDTDRRNRCGAGVLPYELMMPSSEPGATGRGVPNSVSI